MALLIAISSQGAPLLTEFMASNDSGLKDEDGGFSDWIEIHNPDAQPVSLAGFRLTDDPARVRGWTLPAITLNAGAYLVVFASGKNRTNPAAPLHTDFQLAAAGEFLALVAPDGVTVVSSFDPAYPPQFENESFGVGGSGGATEWQFYRTPTPGARNGAGTRAGPVLTALEQDPPVRDPGPLTVAVRVRPTNLPVAGARLFHRRMFGAEVELRMVDDGTAGDVTAGDGVWTAVIPGSAFGPGEMTRWRFTAVDTAGTVTLEPAYRSPTDSERYLGTVSRDARVSSALPVLHWFTTNTVGAGTLAGSRGSVFYDGEFYDNVGFSLHGQSSAGFPKKSYNLDFNRTHRFRWSTQAPRVADIDLLSNWADKSKVRHVLAYEVMRESGVPAHFAFTVRVQQNGAFFSTADVVEDADERYLERAGLNPAGALYKMYANLLNKDAGNNATNGVEKKTRLTENNSDLQALIDGLDLTGAALDRYLFDHIDLPRCVNMLAANSVIRNIDMGGKNWYAYRDTGRSGEWALLPWDLDLSHGRMWNTQDTYFDNALYSNGYVFTGTGIRWVDRLFAHPGIRAMVLRRIRTLSDRFLQPPPAAGTPESESYYERRLNELSAVFDPPPPAVSDARLDFEKWGSWLQGGTVVRSTNSNPAVETMAEAVQRWKTEYLPARRRFIYQSQIVGRGGEIPLPQTGTPPSTNFTPLLVQGAAAQALVPSGDGLGLAWTGDPAREPFGTSGWIRGTTGVGYERATGYQSVLGLDVNGPMQANNSVYIRLEFDVRDPAAFDRLQLRMKYDDGFVAYLNGALLASANAPDPVRWNSAATVSREANPAAFVMFDVSDKQSLLRPGRNVLAIQGLNDSTASSDMLIVPEIHGGRFVPATSREPRIEFGTLEVSPASGNQDQEFIQLLNPTPVAVDLSGWRLTGGVEHTFIPGTVIPSGGALHLCPDAAAFRARTVSPKGGEGLFVQGGYQGHLSNQGESLVLLDASGATNNVIAYEPRPSDAQRFLVVSEVMYHPLGDGRAEFLELLNISSSVTLDLTGVRFTEGVLFDFTGSTVTSLTPGGRVLVVRDLAAARAAHGTQVSIAGAFAGGTALSNGGERIKLEDASNGTISEFTYGALAPWPAEGEAGYSLVLIQPGNRPDPAQPANWRSSGRPGGSPGGSDALPPPAAPAQDLDRNGEPDLMDYALGNDLGLAPIPVTLSRRPDPVGGSDLLELRHPVSVGAEQVLLDWFASTDLATWREAAADLEWVSHVPLGEGRAVVTHRLRARPSTDPARFFRLQAMPRPSGAGHAH